jgi:ATP-dependent Lhr-like helicase
VFRKYDPGNLLLTQAQQEVLRQELEIDRLSETLLKLQHKTLQLMQVKRPTPFAFPLLVERFRESSSSEKLADRISRMVADLEKAAGAGHYQPEDSVQEQTRFNTAVPGRKRRERVSKNGRPRIIQPRPRHGF